MVYQKGIFLILSVMSLLALASEPQQEKDFQTWLEGQRTASLKNLLRNISPLGTSPGAVVASPTKQEPDYWYHWIRDAALVMDVIVHHYNTAVLAETKAHYLRLILDYMDFSHVNQQTPNPSGGLGEPKFHVDGTAYTGPWGRPQDDGPALRASTLIHFAEILLKEGKSGLVQEHLYGPGQGNRAPALIKRDLDYVSHHWRQTSYDLWEEVRGYHFYTQMVQRKALLEGANLARVMGDTSSAEWYLSQAKQLEKEIVKFWDPSKGVIISTRNRDGGIDYKYSGLDASVILGILHGETKDGFFALTDERVILTAKKISDTFASLYPVNQMGPKGVGIGRYPEDRYDGYSSNGVGNPWILLTNGFAEYYLRLGKSLENFKELPRITFFDGFGTSKNSLGHVAKAVLEMGDDYLRRVQFHADPDGQLSEQMNRWSGYMQGARDLTWSYASFLTAVAHR